MSAPARWSVQQEALHADCKVFRVYKEHCHHPLDHREGDFFVIHSNDWVLALPITDDGRIVMVRQFRFGLRDLSTEVPGGIMDKGENPLLTAVRETEEETGFTGGKATLLGSCAPNPAIQRNQCHFVLLEGVRATGTRALDEHEELQVICLHPKLALVEALQNPHTHSLALIALYRLRDARPELFS
jgi:ADP-ribose pyrophosphatase